MREKPTWWEYLTTFIVLLLCGAWAIYEYRKDPLAIPFEPIIAVTSYAIVLLGWRWKKDRPQADAVMSTQQAGKIYNIEAIENTNFGTTVQDAKNTVSGSTIRAKSLHIGDVVQYGDKKILRFLGSAVSKPEVLEGRETDLQHVHKTLFQGKNLLLLVNGEGGIGKTSLAAEYYFRYGKQYKHLAWVFAGEDMAEALLELARPLQVMFEPDMPREIRLQRLFEALRNLHGPSLLVIDNANHLADLDANYPLLRTCPNFHLLLTTRITEYRQADTHKIDPLEQKVALQVFRTHYKALETSEIPLFHEIYTAVQGNTLVLELLAKNLNNFNTVLKKKYLLAELRADLETGLTRLSRSQTVSTTYQANGQGLRHEKPEAIIAAMYDLGELPAEERALLSVFAVLPAASIPFETLQTLLPDQENLDTYLLSLAQKGWIEYGEKEAAFKCSPVVQEVIKHKTPDLLTDCRSLLQALTRELSPEIIHLDNYRQSSLYVRYAETAIRNLDREDDDLATLCQNVGNFHSDTGDLNKAMQAYQKMADIQSALYSEAPDNQDFKNGLAISYSKLGKTHTALGNLSQALKFYELDVDLTKQLYEDYPQNVQFKNGLAISYSKLGETQAALGNLPQALKFYEDETSLFEQLYEAYPQNVQFKNGLAIAYEKLGETHAALGNLPQALKFYEDETNLFEQLYEAYPQNVRFKNGLAVSHSKLGETQAALGNLPQALKFYEDFAELMEQLYEAYPQNVQFKNGLASSYAQLGSFYRDKKGDTGRAKQEFEKCYTLLKELTEAYPAYVSFKNNFERVKKALAAI